ncbi:SMC-Scp complex subunit ScpB [Dellaglioa sp. BT-FLS60]
MKVSHLANIEGLLFVSGDQGISLSEIARLTGLMKSAVKEQLEKLAIKYINDVDSGLELIQYNDFYQLVTKKDLANLIKDYFDNPNSRRLSAAALETLAIIAYKQPVTRLIVDDIRGVQSSGSLQKLVALNLVSESGRLDVPGRPILYKTTIQFLNYFGLTSLKELPEIDENQKFNVEVGQLFWDSFNEKLQEDEE